MNLMLPRPQLDRAVAAALARSPVVAVIAPAGFGKTVAAAHWLHLREDGAGPAAQAKVVDDSHLESEQELAAAAAAAHSGGPAVIFLGRPGGDTALDILAADPQTVVVGPEYLALDRRALQDRFGNEGAALHARTGGWPIAVWALTSGPREPGGWPLSLARYLDEQVLAGLEPTYRRLLFGTSVLSQFRAGTAVHLMGQQVRSELVGFARLFGLLVAQTEDAQLGLEVDHRPANDGHSSGEDQLYWWPEVIASAVRLLADQEDIRQQRIMARSAAAHLRDSDPIAAAKYANIAGDLSLLVEIVLTQWPELVISAEAEQVESLLSGLPEQWSSRAELVRIRACCLRTLGREELIPALLARARARERSGIETAGWVAAVSDVYLLDDRAEVSDATAHAEAEAAAWCPPRQLLRVRLLLASVRVRSGVEADGGVQLATELLLEARESGEPSEIQLARGISMRVMATMGRFRDLSTLVTEEREEFAKVPGAPRLGTGIGWFAEAFVAYWTGDQERALQLFQNLGGMSVTAEWRWLGAVYYAGLVIETRREDLLTGAIAGLLEVPHRPKFGLDWPGVRAALQIRMRIFRDDRVGSLDHLVIEDDTTAAILAGALADSGRLAEAETVIAGRRDRWLPLPAKMLIELVDAQVAYQSPGHEAANRHVDSALALAARSGVLGPLLVAGPTVDSLLSKYIRDGGTHGDLAQEVLAQRANARFTDRRGKLTDREREVLTLLAEDLSQQQIAAELGVSINTVKTHARTIYRKLGVANRREAAAVWGGLKD